MTEATIRSATPEDIPALAKVFLAGLAASLPHRDIAAEFYVYERDVAAPDGKLWKRLTKQLKEENVVLAEIEGEIVGYVTWYIPKVINEGGTMKVYKPGEINFLFVDPSQHGRGLGTLLITHAKASALAAAQELRMSSVSNLLEGDSVVVMNVYCFSKNVAGISSRFRQSGIGGITRSEGGSQLS